MRLNMGQRSEWEEIKPLGEGGQSKVFLVRRPARRADRVRCLKKLMELSGQGFNETRARENALATFVFAREEEPSELAALKVFNPRAAGVEAEEQSLARLRSEIAVLSQKRPGLLRLLDSNESERWIVTEFCPGETLEKNISRFAGNPVLALTAFRTLAHAVAALHDESIVHRDIKPANVFISDDGGLILGDFGIVFLPNLPERCTFTDESVGPRDYMPPWADAAQRLNKVEPNFDVYMLGKLLWCMVAGRLKLPREWHNRPEYPEYDLTQRFKDESQMYSINAILDKCIVEDPKKCLRSAGELVNAIDEHLGLMRRGGQALSVGVPRPCRICGKGFYKASGDTWGSPDRVLSVHSGSSNVHGQGPRSWRQEGVLYLRPLACDICRHIELFVEQGSY
jgi:serine/threonine protein kinase